LPRRGRSLQQPRFTAAGIVRIEGTGGSRHARFVTDCPWSRTTAGTSTESRASRSSRILILRRRSCASEPYTVPTDERFDEIPGKARLELVKRVRACLEKLADPQGRALLEAIRGAFPAEAGLVGECEAGMKAISGG